MVSCERGVWEGRRLRPGVRLELDRRRGGLMATTIHSMGLLENWRHVYSQVARANSQGKVRPHPHPLRNRLLQVGRHGTSR